MAAPTRIILVGTDTEVGKTTVATLLLVRARALSLRVAPFKLAESGTHGLPPSATDTERLLVAAGLPPARAHLVCPHRYGPPVAPGVAHDPTPFTRPGAPADPTPLRQAMVALGRILAGEATADLPPDLVVLEGAGGLHVPMPGGTWQPEWLRAAASPEHPGPAHVVLVARAGLGTLNHTLLTHQALTAIGLRPAGFFLTHPGASADSGTANPSTADPSTATNAAILSARTAMPLLGEVFPHHTPTAPPADWPSPHLAALLPLRP